MMKPEEAARLLQAYADGELGPAASLEMEAALAADPGLREALGRIRAMSAAIRENADYHAAPPRLASRIRASLPDRPARPPAKMLWRFSAALAGIAALATIVFLMRPAAGDRVADELLASHARATVGQRMIDVASSDLHTVKPWLSARLPYSPPVADLAAEGFPLAGGRVDYIGDKPVAVLVYMRRKHTIEVFVWPEEHGGARTLARVGLNLESFTAGAMRYWLVSDVGADELGELARLLGKS
jgi:anti-sigma factor RsiW